MAFFNAPFQQDFKAIFIMGPILELYIRRIYAVRNDNMFLSSNANANITTGRTKLQGSTCLNCLATSLLFSAIVLQVTNSVALPLIGILLRIELKFRSWDRASTDLCFFNWIY